jgi:hypothetical protein
MEGLSWRISSPPVHIHSCGEMDGVKKITSHEIDPPIQPLPTTYVGILWWYGHSPSPEPLPPVVGVKGC